MISRHVRGSEILAIAFDILWLVSLSRWKLSLRLKYSFSLARLYNTVGSYRRGSYRCCSWVQVSDRVLQVCLAAPPSCSPFSFRPVAREWWSSSCFRVFIIPDLFCSVLKYSSAVNKASLLLLSFQWTIIFYFKFLNQREIAALKILPETPASLWSNI